MGAILTAVGLGPGGLSATSQQLPMAVPYAVPAMLAGSGIASLLSQPPRPRPLSMHSGGRRAGSWLLVLDLDCVFGSEPFQEVLGEQLHIVPLGVLMVA